MTDKRKVLHAIEVLKELEIRIVGLEVSLKNLQDLRTLLEKPHSTGDKVKKPLTPGSVMCAEWLHSLIKHRKPNFREPNWPDWYAEMDKIMRIDRRTCEQLHELIGWCQQDSFWQNNILSPSKLRKQLDRLELPTSRDNPALANTKISTSLIVRSERAAEVAIPIIGRSDPRSKSRTGGIRRRRW